MATQPDFADDDQIDDTADDTADDTQVNDAADEDAAATGSDDDDEPGFADEPQQGAGDSDLVRTLRAQLRERDRVIASSARQEQPIVVGNRPELSDYDYDEAKHAEAVDEWHDRKRKAERVEEQQRDREAKQQEEWGKITQDFETKKAGLTRPERIAAAQSMQETLSPTTQAVLAKHLSNAPSLLAAVWNSPARRAELEKADIAGDPFGVLAVAVRMEASLTTIKKSTRPPDPDEPVKGRTVSQGGDKQRAKLEESARKSGDRSALIAYDAANRSN